MATRFAAEAQSFGSVSLPTFLNHNVGINGDMSSGAAAARDWMTSTLKRAEALNARRQMADPVKTRAGNALEIERMADQFNAEATASVKRAREALAASTRDIEAKLNAASATPATANAAELRTVLRGMKPADRQKAFRAALDAGDKELIGAVVHGHALSHGIDANAVAALHDNYQRKVAPVEYAALAEHRRYADWLGKAELHAMRFGAAAYEGTQSYAKQRERAEAVLSSFGFKFED